jgi:hypothetical protein
VRTVWEQEAGPRAPSWCCGWPGQRLAVTRVGSFLQRVYFRTRHYFGQTGASAWRWFACKENGVAMLQFGGSQAVQGSNEGRTGSGWKQSSQQPPPCLVLRPQTRERARTLIAKAGTRTASTKPNLTYRLFCNAKERTLGGEGAAKKKANSQRESNNSRHHQKKQNR